MGPQKGHRVYVLKLIDFFDFFTKRAKKWYLCSKGLWNLHTISVLVMLSRGPGGFHDYIKPMKYMDTGHTDQVFLYCVTPPTPVCVKK